MRWVEVEGVCREDLVGPTVRVGRSGGAEARPAAGPVLRNVCQEFA
jgi:hypothetical protein